MLEEIAPLQPVHFFSFSLDIPEFHGKFQELGSLSDFYGDGEDFAKVSIAWSEKGIFCKAVTMAPLIRSFFPDVTRGDSLELFIDTRNIKTSQLQTKFCHHFYFLPQSPEKAEVSLKGEISRFRGAESRPLADPDLIVLETTAKRASFEMAIFIPHDALYGYEPREYPRLGFAYRVNRSGGSPQYFSVSEDNFSIANNPMLWATLNMVKG